INELVNVASPVKQRIFRMKMKMSEFGHGLSSFYRRSDCVACRLKTRSKPIAADHQKCLFILSDACLGPCRASRDGVSVAKDLLSVSGAQCHQFHPMPGAPGLAFETWESGNPEIRDAEQIFSSSAPPT